MTAFHGAFNSDESRVGRALITAAHLMLYAMAINAVCAIALRLGLRHWLLEIAGFASFGLVVVGVLHNYFTRLCVRCMQDVPADAGHRAESQKWILWLNHSMDSKRYWLLLIAADLAISQTIRRFGFPQMLRWPVTLFLIVYPYSIWLHHRVRPWCPYCDDWGDGGSHELVPGPVRTRRKT